MRLHPLRGDSFSFFSELYARRFTEFVGRGGLRARLVARAPPGLGSRSWKH